MGDFNTVINPKLDRYGAGVSNNKGVCEKIKQLCESQMLTDVWRDRNENKMEFSWKRKSKENRLQASRIDYALVSQGVDYWVESTIYVSAFHTDHRAFQIGLDIHKKDRGKGFWKFNCELLSSIDFVNTMNDHLDILIQERENWHPTEAWESIKKEIKKFTQNYSRKHSKDKQIAISQLIESISEMESRLPLNEREYALLDKSKLDLEELIDENIKSIMFRSKCKWYEEGEKNTKYFLSLERARYNAKTCQILLDENNDNKEIKDDHEILNMQRSFYSELYSDDPSVDFKLINETGVEVDENERQLQNKSLKISELADAARGMKNNKTPGPDGIPIDFYKVFWVKIGHILLRVYDTCYDEFKMIDSSMSGVLNLIPKANKDPRFLKNLRPITLLNADYKLIEKVINNRMLPAMHEIIHNDQKGFLTGRKIAGNIRKIFDLINYTKEKNIEAIILNLDWGEMF